MAAERGSLITVVLCFNANGDFVPPLFVFPRKRRNPIFEKGAPEGSIFTYHPSGWIQTTSFMECHFVECTQPTKSSPVLLILDGHFSHTRNFDLIMKARESHVCIVSLPPHCSHKIQPLDKSFMYPLKTAYNEEKRLFTRREQRIVTLYDVATLFAAAYTKCRVASYGINGFRITGIYPFNKDMFQDAEFVASEMDEVVQFLPLRKSPLQVHILQ